MTGSPGWYTRCAAPLRAYRTRRAAREPDERRLVPGADPLLQADDRDPVLELARDASAAEQPLVESRLDLQPLGERRLDAADVEPQRFPLPLQIREERCLALERSGVLAGRPLERLARRAHGIPGRGRLHGEEVTGTWREATTPAGLPHPGLALSPFLRPLRRADGGP